LIIIHLIYDIAVGAIMGNLNILNTIKKPSLSNQLAYFGMFE